MKNRNNYETKKQHFRFVINLQFSYENKQCNLDYRVDFHIVIRPSHGSSHHIRILHERCQKKTD